MWTVFDTVHSESTESYNHSLLGPMKTLVLQSDHMLTGCSAGHIVNIVSVCCMCNVSAHQDQSGSKALEPGCTLINGPAYCAVIKSILSLRHGPAYCAVMALIQTLIRAKCRHGLYPTNWALYPTNCSPRRKANGRKARGESLANGSDLHYFHQEWWRLQANAAVVRVVQSRQRCHHLPDKYQHVLSIGYHASDMLYMLIL